MAPGVEWLRLTILDDNEPAPGLLSEWGWSVYLEAPVWRALFDADTSPRVIEHNARVLGAELEALDWGFLSHHHRDHKGGYPAAARARPGLRVYAPPGPLEDLEAWGLSPQVVTAPGPVAEAAYSTGPLYSSEWSLWEHALAVQVEGLGPVVIVGCSHPGVDRLVEKALSVLGEEKAALVIGGFHAPPASVLDNLAEKAETVCPAHCSGDQAKRYMARRYPGKYCSVRTGTVLRVTAAGVEKERD